MRSIAAKPEEKAAKPEEKTETKMMVAACGMSCSACPLMAAKKCKGCAPGNKAPAEMVEMKKCPVLSCAQMKKVAYCGTGCKGFTKCEKLIDHPYSKPFMKNIADRSS